MENHRREDARRIGIGSLFATQRRFNRLAQVWPMVLSLSAGDRFPLVQLHRVEDGRIIINDGHHRLLAFWLCGRQELYAGEYDLIDVDCVRPCVGLFIDLVQVRDDHG